ncbi:MAG: hypothetical protein NTX03_03435 [Bacteroidetes bacterium]|nr:hypothetical protein [Bacteroidota bacterium]
MKKIFCIVFFLLQGLLATSQDSLAHLMTKPIKVFHHGVGVGLGYSTGGGFSYKYTYKRIGAQINFSYGKGRSSVSFYTDDYHTRTSNGLTLIYILVDGSPYSNFYLYQGNHYYYSTLKTITTDSKNQVTQVSKSSSYTFTSGVGLGTEIILFKRIGFNLMGGYALYFKGNKPDQLNFTLETALHFKF